MDKKGFKKIVEGIKTVKIQGARNVAKKALFAYNCCKTEKNRKKLLSLRPTEPMLQKVLKLAKKEPYENIISHFDYAQEKINKATIKLIKNKDVIFTHCHSTNVIGTLIYAKNNKKRFEVYNTETRPLFQGRKTAKELGKAKIKVTMFVDSAIGVALSKEIGTKKANKVFIGADAITKNGVINKIGSETIARLAKEGRIPVYVIADSWKFTKKNLPIEERTLNEVWDKAPKSVKIKNPAFEFVPKKLIKGVVSEFGVLSFEDFVKRVLQYF
jgi:ribose 1,5-bisphosphate isomerase